MRLSPFLQFLELHLGRLGLRDQAFEEGFRLHGHLRVENQLRGGPAEVVYDDKNFIVDLGKTSVRNMLLGAAGSGAGGFLGSVFRMAIGDGGAPASELLNPKAPDATWPARTTLFHEVLRQDISAFSAPTTSAARFVGAFNSLDVDSTSYSLAAKVINEAALIIGDGTLTVGGDKKQVN